MSKELIGIIVHIRSLSKNLLFINLCIKCHIATNQEEVQCIEIIAKNGICQNEPHALLKLKKSVHLGDEVVCTGRWEDPEAVPLNASSHSASFLLHSITVTKPWRSDGNQSKEFQPSAEQMEAMAGRSKDREKDKGKQSADDSSERSQQPCKFFINTSKCTRGESCPFSHPISADGRPDKTILKSWLLDRAAQRRERAVCLGFNNNEVSHVTGHDFSSAAEKSQRAVILASWIVETFGTERLNSGSGVIDVGGGRGGLTFELQFIHGVKVTLIDTRPFKLSRRQHKRMDERGLSEGDDREGMFDPLIDLVKPRRVKEEQVEIESTLHAPRINLMEGQFHQIQSFFTPALWKTEHSPISNLLRNASLVVGLHPDQATNAILDFALETNKPFVLVPCCVFPSMFERYLEDGEPVLTTVQLIHWINQRGGPNALTTALPFQGANTVCYRQS